MTAMKLEPRRAGALAAGLGALLVTAGCGAADLRGVSTQAAAQQPAGLPVVVACEPHQRTLVRPVVIDGATVSQVECVAADESSTAVARQTAATPAAPRAVAQAAAPQPVYRQTQAAQPVYEYEDARVVPATYPEPTVQRVPERRVIYDREPETIRKKRSVKKSAVIIGSSAGVGAGVGAAIGGKKGALIGAAIGGGGAAIWDQVTRRK